jgi:hypothetical protein
MISQLVLLLHFDGSFWKVQVERRSDGMLSVATHIFGTEPSDAEVYAWWLADAGKLYFSSPVAFARLEKEPKSSRSKKMRLAARSLCKAPVTPEIRAAAQAERRQRRVLVRSLRKENRLIEAEEKRRLRKAKALAKKKGR